MEKTFMMVKPDGVQRGLIGKIITRIEERGMKIIAMKFIRVSDKQAEEHYAEHVGKVFYEPLIKYIKSGPVVVMVIEGQDAVSQMRKLVGKTDPSIADPGTIRQDFAQSIRFNVVHAADKPEAAVHEWSIYFSASELVEYNLDIHKWMFSQ
jgi:nucleoside-diphosphate kinase